MACLCPRNSISNVVASVTTHDDILKIKWKRCSKKHETIVEGHKHIHVTHLHMHIHMYVCVCVCEGEGEGEEREGRGVVLGGSVGRWVGEYVLVRVCVVFVVVSVVLVFVSVVLVFVSVVLVFVSFCCVGVCVFVLVFPRDS